MEKIIEIIKTIRDFVIAIYSFWEWIVAKIENFLIIASSLGSMIAVILALLVLTIRIFRKTISKSHRTRVKEYEADKEITKATELNQIKTKNTVYIWLKYIYSLMEEYNEEKQSIHMVKIYCEWLIGFFRFTILGRWIATIFTIYLVLGAYIQQSHQQRLATFSNTIAQTETFLHGKYPTQELISNDKGQLYYYGSAIDLKGALEFLHKNDRQFTFLYLPRTELGLVKLSGAFLWYANFSHAYLNMANFNKAELLRANFSGANLYRAKFNGAKLIITDIEKADLYKAEFRGANMDRANLKGAVITATDFTGAENLIPEQIMKACWLRADTYIVDGEKIIITDEYGSPPILPDYLKDFKVHELPEAKLKNNDDNNNTVIAYCP